MILMIDNYDSFTYNLVQYFGELKAKVEVYRNDALSIAQIRKMKPAKIVISPGPGRPEDAGISIEIIKQLGPTIPVLGVCLGHQAIGEAFGGTLTNLSKVYHGVATPIKILNKKSEILILESKLNVFIALKKIYNKCQIIYIIFNVGY